MSLAAAVQKLASVLNRIAAAIAGAALFVLVGVMVFEVVSRYAFNAPTLWAFDVSFMLAGAAFILGGAITLELNRHVTVDVFAVRLPAPAKRAIDLVFYLAVLAIVAALLYVSVGRTYHSIVTAEVVQMSAWRPQIWPFFVALTAGLAALLLQVAARVLATLAPPRIDSE